MTNYLEQQLRIIDGDTFVEDGARKRLSEGNAPEIGDGGAAAATNFLERELAKNPTQDVSSTGYFGRQLVDLDSGGVVKRGVEQGYFQPTVYDDKELQATHRKYINRIAAGPDPSVTPDDQLAVDKSLITQRILNSDPSVAIRNQQSSRIYNSGGTFSKALSRGKDQLDSLLYAAGNAGGHLVGDLIGTDTLDDWGEDGLKRNLIDAAMNPAEIQKWDDVKSLSDAWTYIVEALGEQAPNLAAMAVSGGVGGAVAKTAAKAAAAKQLTKFALKHAARKGATAGVAAASYGMGVGEIHQELQGAGIDAPGTAFIAGVPFAALDTIGFQKTIGRLFQGVDSDIATQSVKDIAKSVLGAIGEGSAAEASTEMLQELVSITAHAYHDPTFEIFSDENLSRIKEAGIKAGIVGGISAGGATGANKIYGKATAPLESDPIDPSPEAAPPTEDKYTPPTFPHRDRDYSYVGDQVSVPAADFFDGADPNSVMGIRKVLETKVDPEIDTAERDITAYEALKRCLG